MPEHIFCVWPFLCNTSVLSNFISFDIFFVHNINSIYFDISKLLSRSITFVIISTVFLSDGFELYFFLYIFNSLACSDFFFFSSDFLFLSFRNFFFCKIITNAFYLLILSTGCVSLTVTHRDLNTTHRYSKMVRESLSFDSVTE